ncbi:MAG: translocation/assembly module TamB domain-containing protein [Spirochaetaceae bacterium]
MAVRGSSGVVQIVLFFLLLVATAIGLGPLQSSLRSRLDDAREEIVGEIETLLGRPIAYTGIAPSVFRSIKIEDPLVFADETRRETVAEAQSLRIYFSLWDLLTGPAIDGVREVTLEDAQISVDAASFFEGNAFGNGSPGLGELFGERSFPEELTLSATNVDLVVASGTESVTLMNLVTRFDFRKPTLEFELRSSAGYRVPLTGDSIAAEVVLSGSVEEGLEQGTGSIEFPRLAYGDWELRDQAFALRYGDRNIALRKVRNRDPLEISLDVNLEQQVATGRVLAEGFVPSSVVSGPVSDGVLPSLLFSSVDADAEAEYSLESGELRVTGRTEARFPDNPAKLAHFEAETDGSVDAFEGSFLIRDSGGGRVRGRAEKAAAGRDVRASLDFRNLQIWDAPVVSGDVRLRGSRRGATLFSEELSIGAGMLYATSLEVDHDQTAIATQVRTHFNSEETQALELSGSISLGEASRFDLDGALRQVPVAGVRRLAEDPQTVPSPTTVLDSLVVDSVFSLSSRGGNVDLDAPFVSLYDLTAPDETFLYFSLVQGEEEVAAERISASYGGFDVGGRVVIGDPHNGTTPIQVSLTHDAGRYSAQADYHVDGRLTLTGDYGSELTVVPRKEGGVLLSASIVDAPAAPLGENARLTADLDGFFFGSGAWTARLSRLDIVDASSPTGPLTIRARGDFDPTGGRLAPMVIDDGVDTLAGSVGITAGDEGEGALINGTLTSGDGEESLLLAGSLDAAGLSMNLRGDGVGLRRFGIPGLRGQVDFAAEATGTPGDLSLRGTINVPDGQLAGDAFTASGRFTVSEQSLRIQGVQVRRGENRLDVTSAVADLSEGSIAVSARLTRGIGVGETVTGVELGYQRRVEEPFSAVRQVIEDPFSADIRLEGINIVGVPQEEWLFSLRRTTSGVTLRGAPDNAIRGQISNDGEFRLVLTDPLPVRFQAAGLLGDGAIEATITRISAELPITEATPDFVPEERPGGRFLPLRGEVEGSLRVVGPVNDPDLFGTLSVESLEAEVPYVEGVVDAPQAFVLFQEKMIQVDRFLASRGDADATVSATLLLSRWGLDEFEVLINTIGDEGMPITQDFGPVAVDGRGLGRLRIYGTPATTDVSGEVIAEETTITLITEDVVEVEPRKITTVDLTLVAGRRLEFLWPSREVPIVRAFARAGHEVRLVSESEDESFGLDGTVSIRGGEIFYVNRNFYMRQGRIVFDEDEAGFDPILSARAELREVGPQGPVRIFLIAEENPLSQFSPRLESTPPLTDDEIVALLGGAILEEGSTDVANLGSAVAVTSEVVTQFGILSQFERQVREALNVDLFSVRTQVFQNIVIGSLDQSEVPLDTTAPSLGTYLDNTTVFLGKYLGSDLFLELLIELRARDPLDQDVIALGGMEVDPEIGLEFDTPFFLLQWSFFPRTPESLFVADNTFEFSWQFSY